MSEEIDPPFKSITIYDRLVAVRHRLASLTRREALPPKLTRHLVLEQAEDRTVPSITLTAHLMSDSITAGGSTGVTGSASTGTGMSSLVVIEDGGRTRPGQKPTAATLGRSPVSVSANDLVWEFFQKHRMT